ncbi:Chromate resistance protein ChrB [Nonomuraea jiangxiensis]|uniref:Chromate resistance protein ChrB n=1 Tax=Nonomuraea jiangxiensis TaxID=633440 RepID=UPI000B81FF6D|nr:Chromate resistance protein ChrB [Nonomuraea jiangxiensis]
MTDNTEGEGWLLVSVSTAGAAPTLRVQVWRKLRSLGALYLQQSVCLLPEREQTLRQVRRLLDRVHQQGGTGRMLRLTLTDPAEERQIIAEFNTARDAEYTEVLERLPTFRAELAAERQRGRATYAEVEESEADLERFRSWLAKIAARDYFAAPAAAMAQSAVEDAAADLAAFEQSALAAEAPAEISIAVPEAQEESEQA